MGDEGGFAADPSSLPEVEAGVTDGAANGFPPTGGISPRAFTHLSLINAVMSVIEAEQGSDSR